MRLVLSEQSSHGLEFVWVCIWACIAGARAAVVMLVCSLSLAPMAFLGFLAAYCPPAGRPRHRHPAPPPAAATEPLAFAAATQPPLLTGATKPALAAATQPTAWQPTPIPALPGGARALHFYHVDTALISHM